MKITNNTYLNKTNTLQPHNTRSTDNSLREVRDFDDVKYSRISFGAITGVKKKKVDIETEQKKLLKQINEILTTDTPDVDMDDFIRSQVHKCINFLKNKRKKAENIEKHAEEVYNDPHLNPQQKMNILGSLSKQLNMLKKNKYPNFDIPKHSPNNELIDFKIYNKFKTAIDEDNFNLEKVYADYYSDMNNIKTIEELHEKYPKIKTPKNPADAIAEKYISTLTRDFYLKLDYLIKNKNENDVINLLDETFAPMIEDTAKKFKKEPNVLYSKLEKNIVGKVMAKYEKIIQNGTLTSIPEFIKNKTPQINEADVELLTVFDEFVTDVIKEIYIGKKKPNDIVFESKNTKISLSSLRNTDYKFEKPSEKIKKLINSAMSLHYAQRDYENFNVYELKNRLNFYTNTKIADNDKIFETMVEFDSCSFTEEDIHPLIKFLKELDGIADGEKSSKEVEKIIESENIAPIGTRKLDDIEKQKRAEELKIEQQKAFKLKTEKENFDNAINILYMNNMTNIAQICAQYRPENLDEKALAESNFIIKTITSMTDPKNYSITNKTRLQSMILHRDTYNNYIKENSNLPIFKKALKYSNSTLDNVNIDKVGQYLMNAEFAENYPECAAMAQNTDLLAKIFEQVDKDKAIEYMCRIDDYNDLDNSEKFKISNILDMFDLKDPIDKIIAKYIVETNYANADTVVITEDTAYGNSKVQSIFTSKAKQAIIDKYKFPLCVKYFSGFEDALSCFSREKGNSGIKSTERNNDSQIYKIEVKLIGKTDRLFSSKNDFCFDIYSDKGLH